MCEGKWELTEAQGVHWKKEGDDDGGEKETIAPGESRGDGHERPRPNGVCGVRMGGTTAS